jgi:hypothetical protein
MHRRVVAAALAAILLSFAVQVACAASDDLPLIDHVVVVVLENHSFDQIVDPHRAPFIHHLATDGALFVNAFAVSHPSQPNYFALFSGSSQGISDNEHHTFDKPTLADALNAAGKSFVGYVETGSPRKHNPWNPLSTLVRPNGTSVSSRVILRGCRQSALSSPTSITICMTDRCALETLGSRSILAAMPNGQKRTTAC